MKNKVIIGLLIIVTIAISYNLTVNYSLRNINKSKIDVLQFVSVTDKVGGNNIQINWKDVAAILGVTKKNNFEEISNKDIKDVSLLFLDKVNDKYKLNSFDYVLNKLDFSKKEIKRAYEYKLQLKNFGLKPKRLAEDSNYSNFINSIKAYALQNYKNYKILPSITIAQSILESGWGQSKLAKEHKNLFGIKADSSWEGEYVALQTRENQNDIINDEFRTYETMGQSINDHGRFLYENQRYKENGVFDSKTYIYQAKALEQSGYSTDMGDDGQLVYADKLVAIIRQYNLQVIDSTIFEK